MKWKWTWDLEISPQLLETIRSLPVHRSVTHCGESFQISPFDFYLNCPRCGAQVKVRSFTGLVDVEDVFDAVFAWMNQPGAEELVRRRREIIRQDQV